VETKTPNYLSLLAEHILHMGKKGPYIKWRSILLILTFCGENTIQ